MKNTIQLHKETNTKKATLTELADLTALTLAVAESEEDKYSLKAGIKAFYTALKR